MALPCQSLRLYPEFPPEDPGKKSLCLSVQTKRMAEGFFWFFSPFSVSGHIPDSRPESPNATGSMIGSATKIRSGIRGFTIL